MPNAKYIKRQTYLSYVPYWLQNRTEPNQARDRSWWNVASRTNCAYSYCGRRLMTVAPLYAGIGGKGVGGVEVEVVVGVVDGGGGRPRRARWNTVHSPQSPQQSQQQPPPDAGIGTSYAQQPHSAGSLTCLYTLDAYLTQFVSFVPFEKLTYLPQRRCDSSQVLSSD